MERQIGTTMISRWRARHGGETGAVLLIAVAGMVVALVAAGLAVDVGRVAQERRRDQKVADMAALDAARDMTKTLELAQKSATRNGFDYGAPGHSLTTEVGSVDASGNFLPGVGSSAVRVTVSSPLSNDFMPGSRTVSAKGVATQGNGKGCMLPNDCVVPDGNPLGSVRVGSSLASIDTSDATILNRQLSNFTGGSVNLTAASWNGLADGNVTLKRLATALNVGSPREVLNSTVTYRQLLQATVSALNADGSPSSAAAATPLGSIVSQVSAAGGGQVQMGKLFSLVGNAGSGSDVAEASFNVLRDVVVGSATVADTDHFGTFNLAAGDVGAIPGFQGATVNLGLIEAPRTAHGAPGKDASGVYRTTAETAQVRALVNVRLKVSVTTLGLLDVTVPYYLDAGQAAASLDSMTCPDGAATPSAVKIYGVTSTGSTKLGNVSNAGLSNTTTAPTPTTATLVNVAGLVKVDTNTVLSSSIPGNSAMLTFNPDYATAPSQPVPGTTLTIPSLAAGNLNVTTLGLITVSTATIATDIANGVNAALPGIKTEILRRVYKTLGLSFAGADVWAPVPQECQPTSYKIDPGSSPADMFPVLVG